MEHHFRQQGLWEQIESGALREVVVAQAPSHAIPGGTSRIINHVRGTIYVATTHQLLDQQGSPYNAKSQPYHWHAKAKDLPDGTRLVSPS
ncbi:MAG: hypothetical protein ACRDJN_05700 [Chloroflexota bacterium]